MKMMQLFIDIVILNNKRIEEIELNRDKDKDKLNEKEEKL